MSIKKIIGIALAAIIISLQALAGTDPADNLPGVEEDMNKSISATVFNLIKRLPQIWSLKREAKKLAAALPEYSFPGPVTAPDSELIYSWIAALCQTPHRRPGTPEDRAAEEWIAQKFREFGLEKVALEPMPIKVWSAEKWELSVGSEKVPAFFVVNTGFTPPGGVTGKLAYVGEGKPGDFAKVDVKGKVVVAEVPFPYIPTGALFKLFNSAYVISDPDHNLTLGTGQYLNFVRDNFRGGNTEQNAPDSDVYWNAYKRGAAAICLILKDQPSHYNTHYGPYDGVMKPMPGLWVGKYDGVRLRELARSGAEATVTLTGTMKDGETRNVWGMLPGISDEVILVTSHHDSPFTGASEDAAGASQVLAQAYAWSRVPKASRPKTLVFVIDAGHFYGSIGGRAFAKSHPEVMSKVKILITPEHLAAKEVREQDGEYVETGKLALTVMFTSPEPKVIAAIMKAFSKKPPKITVSMPADFFGKAPTSDASGYVLESGVPVISWIGCPYYLLDSGDTLDKIDQTQLQPIAETVAELVKVFMVMN